MNEDVDGRDKPGHDASTALLAHSVEHRSQCPDFAVRITCGSLYANCEIEGHWQIYDFWCGFGFEAPAESLRRQWQELQIRRTSIAKAAGSKPAESTMRH
jgi:hypothetical protein